MRSHKRAELGDDLPPLNLEMVRVGSATALKRACSGAGRADIAVDVFDGAMTADGLVGADGATRLGRVHLQGTLPRRGGGRAYGWVESEGFAAIFNIDSEKTFADLFAAVASYLAGDPGRHDAALSLIRGPRQRR
jgi:hypothetical protein